MDINKITEFRSCITCVYRRFYPPAIRNGQPVFSRFYCGLAIDSSKDIVKPEDICDYWRGVTLGVE